MSRAFGGVKKLTRTFHAGNKQWEQGLRRDDEPQSMVRALSTHTGQLHKDYSARYEDSEKELIDLNTL